MSSTETQEALPHTIDPELNRLAEQLLDALKEKGAIDDSVREIRMATIARMRELQQETFSHPSGREFSVKSTDELRITKKVIS